MAIGDAMLGGTRRRASLPPLSGTSSLGTLSGGPSPPPSRSGPSSGASQARLAIKSGTASVRRSLSVVGPNTYKSPLDIGRAQPLADKGVLFGAFGKGKEDEIVSIPRPRPKVDCLPAVIFMDVDGVLHPTTVKHPRQQFQASCMALLREAVEATGATIVLSTAWRLDPGARRAVGDKLREHGLPLFVSQTPNIHQFHRAKEILSWVRNHKPLTWVSVDDWPLMDEGVVELNGHFVQTRPRYGLLPEEANRIKELFQAQQAALPQAESA